MIWKVIFYYFMLQGEEMGHIGRYVNENLQMGSSCHSGCKSNDKRLCFVDDERYREREIFMKWKRFVKISDDAKSENRLEWK